MNKIRALIKRFIFYQNTQIEASHLALKSKYPSTVYNVK